MVLGLLCACFPAAAGALQAHRACGAPTPGRAACMAERLLTGTSAAAPLSGTPNTAGRRSGASPYGASPLNKPVAGALTPEMLREAYELPSETPEASTQTIAIVDALDDPTAEADLGVYSSQYGLPACTSQNGCFKKVNQEGNASPLPEPNGGWASEISIDVQMAHAVCPGCHILLLEANSEEFTDLGAAVKTAANMGATVISNSYGGPEEGSDTALATSDYTHPGTPVLASSGDCGYLNEAPSLECATLAHAANFPADSPAVISVGGTSLTDEAGGWTSTAWNEGGSGCSTIFEAGLWQLAAAGFPATGCGKGRAVADVSAIGDPNTGVNVYDSTPEEPGRKAEGWGQWGGTSVAAPIVAAEFALAGGGHSVLYPAATLYSHLGEASSVYDVTAGSNGACKGTTICSAASGYDGPTGVGSPIGLGAFAITGSPKSTAAPGISGYPEQAQTLTEAHGGWTGAPTSYSYQWERCGPGGKGCLAVAGATGSSYLLGSADIGFTLRVVEFAHNATGSGAAASAVTGVVASDLPSITSFTPASGVSGSTITITGSSFTTTSHVLVGKLGAAFTVASPTELEVTVPNGGAKGKLSVTNAHGTATSKGKFVTTFGIKSFKPLTAAAGTTITVKGTGFNSSSAVSIAGTPAATTYYSKSKLKAIVPAGVSSGRVTVTNSLAPVGTVESAASFTP